MHQIPVMSVGIKNAIDEQGQGKGNFRENSKELEDEDVIFYSTDNTDLCSVIQEPQKIEKEQKTNAH